MEYAGNAIYEYVNNNDLDYECSVENSWMLVYGNSVSVPKIFVLLSKVDDISKNCSDKEMIKKESSSFIASYLKLPFIFIRFMEKSERVGVWNGDEENQKNLTYNQLRDLYEKYGVVQPGTAKKNVNQYLSNPYHEWQRENLGSITVTDFDMIKFVDGKVEKIIELKRSKILLEKWNPFKEDYPNLALLINTIVASGKKIPLILYYNLMIDGPKGKRVEDISNIKVYDFIIPNSMISSNQVKYSCIGLHRLEDLFEQEE